MTTDLSRFKAPDEPRVIAVCAWCDGDIYEGDEVYRVDDGGGFAHDGNVNNCASEFAMIRVFDGHGVIGSNGDLA